MVITNLSVIKYLTAGHAGGLGGPGGGNGGSSGADNHWRLMPQFQNGQQLQFTNNYLLLLQSLLSHFAEWQLLLQQQTQEAVLQYLPTGVLQCSSRNFTKRNFTVLQYLPTWILQCCSTYQQELYSTAIPTKRNFTVLQHLPKGTLQWQTVSCFHSHKAIYRATCRAAKA